MPSQMVGQMTNERSTSPPSPTIRWVVSHHQELPDPALLGWSDADPGSMRDLRNSTALRQLADLGPDPGPSPWAWAVVRVDPKGRIVLPAEASRTPTELPEITFPAPGAVPPMVSPPLPPNRTTP